MIIETPRLRLRPWTAGDIGRLAALNAEPEVNAWLGGPGLSHHDAALLARITGHFDENGWGIWLVESRQFDPGQPIFIQPMQSAYDSPYVPGPRSHSPSS